MMSNFLDWETIAEKLSPVVHRRLRNGISVPVILLFVMLLGSVSGFGFYIKSTILAKHIPWLDADAQFSELHSLQVTNKWLKRSFIHLMEEEIVLLDSGVEDLNNKSRTIENLLDSVGVDLQFQAGTENSGGPFASPGETVQEELILRSDQYLDAILNVPLGIPVSGRITSKFGRRIDPINGKAAYHRGLDIRGRMGSEIRTTADGIVIAQNYDKIRGKYIKIDHDNGFVTKYAHLKKSLVQEGDVVERGQVIGLVGNSGRSTGPHLHYEIHYDNKIVNPTRFVKIDKHLTTTRKKQ